MKRFLIRIFLLACTILGIVHGWCPEDYSFYIKIDSGVSCSQSADICAPYPPWAPALQGYNAKLGHCAIASASVGCELWHMLDLEASISNRSIFKYRKCQTPTTGGDSYSREFDLNVTPILFCANLLGAGIPYCHWQSCYGTLYPMIGFGVGTSNLAITNYRTTGLPPIGDSSPYLSFSAENQYTLRKNFTYTLLAGVEYNHHDCWAISTGYRWLNAGHFKGPQYQRVSGGSAVDVGCDAWQMRFRAHEWFAEFKIFI